ncbi:unnamed protein product [Phytophthora lilii]|uniref:RxLR effector protein n=1 Tax=Phytophthora lilii TaxID=2077276 RepID=A0A9W6TK42_9STRA|nr:unnamed protein product [Phytophthora lilii]
MSDEQQQLVRSRVRAAPHQPKYDASNLLTATAGTFLASGNAISNAADSEQATLSTMASPDHADAVNVVDDDKRFLRSRNDEDNETPIVWMNATATDGDGDDNDEERLSAEALVKLMRGHTTHKFNLWRGKAYSGSTIWNKLDVDNYPERRKIYDWYVNGR